MKNFRFHVWRRFRMCSLIWLIWYFNIFLQIQIQVPTQHTQQPGNSFIDNNIGIDDLSASFRTIYKNMFETNPAGLSDFSATKKNNNNEFKTKVSWWRFLKKLMILLVYLGKKKGGDKILSCWRFFKNHNFLSYPVKKFSALSFLFIYM